MNFDKYFTLLLLLCNQVFQIYMYLFVELHFKLYIFFKKNMFISFVNFDNYDV